MWRPLVCLSVSLLMCASFFSRQNFSKSILTYFLFLSLSLKGNHFELPGFFFATTNCIIFWNYIFALLQTLLTNTYFYKEIFKKKEQKQIEDHSTYFFFFGQGFYIYFLVSFSFRVALSNLQVWGTEKNKCSIMNISVWLRSSWSFQS